MKPLIVIGMGGHARVLMEVIRACGFELRGFTDVQCPVEIADSLKALYLGQDAKIFDIDPQSVELVNTLGSSKSTARRREIFETFKAKGFHFRTLIHPSAIVASNAVVEEGAQIMAGSVLQPYARIGANTIINTRASIDHDCKIGAHCHIAPGATLSGTVTVGESTHIGTGASIIQGIKIGSGALIAAGAAVVKDVPEAHFARGVPAKVSPLNFK